MTVLSDVQELQREVRELQQQKAELRKDNARLDEQVNGERGLSAALNAQTAEIRGLRKAAYWLAGLIIASSLGFAFSVLLLVPSP